MQSFSAVAERPERTNLIDCSLVQWKAAELSGHSACANYKPVAALAQPQQQVRGDKDTVAGSGAQWQMQGHDGNSVPIQQTASLINPPAPTPHFGSAAETTLAR